MTAAALHGCTAVTGTEVHQLVPYCGTRRRRVGLIPHNGWLPPEDVVEHLGLRVVTPVRAATDLLCTVRARDAIAVIDQMLALHPVDLREDFRAQVRRRLTERPDARGTKRGARILELATGRAESPPESWLLLEVDALGFSAPKSNWPIFAINGREIYRLDLAWPEFLIALEYNGYAVHLDRELEDARRAEDLRRRGWIVLTATADDFADSRELERQLREAFRVRGYQRPC
ncbi:hypothetical protein BKA01_006127 [Pseudonocardia eucalypti]|nr:hypothetical protein [Pseudonocardia eucalypti]